MGRPWIDHESWELVDEASDVTGRDVGKLLLDADADELKDTRNAQLTTFVSSLMVLDAVERIGIDASFCAGHSLGEYTALTATGAIEFEDGIRLVVERAAAMHEAGLERPGTMAAVLGLDDDQVEIACRRADEEVWIANFNAPGQVVIAGSPVGVEAASGLAHELGATRVMSLPVSGAFHTPYMAPAHERLRVAIAAADVRDTEIPIVSNVDALAHDQGNEWSALLSAQLSSPVRWKYCLLELSNSASPTSPSSGPARAHRHGEALDRGRSHDLGLDAGGPRQAARVGWRVGAPRRAPPSRVSTCSPSSGSSSARRQGSSPRSASSTETRSKSVRCWVTSATTRSGRRSRVCYRATSPSTQNASCHVSRSLGCGRADRHRSKGEQTMPAIRPGARGGVISGWGTAVPDKVLTNHELAETMDTSDEWIVARTGIRERRVGGTTVGLSIESGRAGARDVGPRPVRDQCRHPRHDHARPPMG